MDKTIVLLVASALLVGPLQLGSTADPDPIGPGAPASEPGGVPAARVTALPTRTEALEIEGPSPEVLARLVRWEEEAAEWRELVGRRGEAATLRCRLIGEGFMDRAEVSTEAASTFDGDMIHWGAWTPVFDGWVSFEVNGPSGELRFDVVGFYPAFSVWEGLEAGAIGSCGPILLEPAPTHAIIGRVTFEDGRPVEGALVHGCGRHRSSDSDGSYFMPVAVREPCSVSANWNNWSAQWEGERRRFYDSDSVPVDPTQGDEVVDFVLHELDLDRLAAEHEGR